MNSKSKIEKIRIGTRGSPLALTQTNMVCAELAKVYPDLKTEIVIIKTSGDWNPSDGESRLSETQGGKGLFAKEIEQALLRNEIDAAVHSMKDMDSNLPEGLIIRHMLPRQDTRDALIFSKDLKRELKISGQEISLQEALAILPEKARIGTISVRRSAILLHHRPDLTIMPFRGNVQTRLDKLAAGQVDVTLLAIAGLNRLGLSAQADILLPVSDMLPAAGQGAVGIELRQSDEKLIDLFDAISCLKTVLRVKAEREALRLLDGSCHTPIGAHTIFNENVLTLDVQIFSPDGVQRFEDSIAGEVITEEQAVALGYEIGARLKSRIPESFCAR